jgi:hypothetical protein
MRTLTFALTVSLLGCGGAAPSPATPAAAERPPPVAVEAPPEDAVAFVRLLRAIATGSRAGSLDEHIDAEFAQRLPSGDDLAALFSGDPGGCEPALEEGPGYGVIAIPPPMDDDGDAEAARVEAIIEELSASTEVTATCTRTEVIDGEEVAREDMLWGIALRRGADGRFRAMAWRDLRHEDGRRH